jgi:transposase
MKTEHTTPSAASARRKQYPKEYKENAVRLSQQMGARQAAEDLGINVTMLRSWVRTLTADGAEAFRGQGNRTVADAEMARMRREITVLKQEREILKKAAEFWVRECT